MTVTNIKAMREGDLRIRPKQRFASGVAWIIAWLVVPILGLPQASWAELAVFRDGRGVQLPAEVVGDTVRLMAPDCVYEFQREDFRSIQPGHWPEHEWPDRREAAWAGDAQSRFAAAWWALEHGLTDQACTMLRESYQKDPEHQPTARLVDLLDDLEAPLPDPDLDALRRALPEAFQVAQGTRVVLFHQHSEAEARQRVEVLERVLTTFYLSFAAQGFTLRLPERRLPSAWFASQRAYKAYVRAEAGEAFLSTQGYFHPARGFVVTYDARDRANYQRGVEANKTRRAELERVEQRLPARGRFRLSLAGEPTRTVGRTEAQAVLDRLRREVDRDALLLDLNQRAVDLGTASHELIHQLTEISGLAPRHESFPVWLHEGLAAQFEVVRGGRWAGFGRAHDLRLTDWRRISPPPPILPLLGDEGFGQGYRSDRYAAAWALVYYLRKEHPREFVAFLDHLRATGRGVDPDKGNRDIEAFRAVFGEDLGPFEAAWHRYMAGLRTPLETR